MAEITIQCPRCGQHITCDELWCGHQIQCPSCQAAFNVAPKAPAPAAAEHSSLVPKPPSGGSRLSAGATQVARAIPTSQAQAAAATEKLVSKRKQENRVLKWVSAGLTIVALGVGGYFGFQYLKKYQEKYQESVNAKRQQTEQQSGGGEADSSQVSEKTEPGQADSSSSAPARPRQRRNQPAAAETAATDAGGAPEGAAAGDPGAAPAQKELPIVPPVYTLEVSKAKIPESKVNGKITGTSFQAETVRIDRSGSATSTHVMRLCQGNLASPDREILIYLKLKPGESPTNQTITVSQDMRSPMVSQVAKRWKTDPKYAPQNKPFYTGYALKLELGKMADDGSIQGQIFVALPDAEQSVVAGVFKAASSQPDPNAQPMVSPGEMPQGVPPSQRSAFERRYGRPTR